MLRWVRIRRRLAFVHRIGRLNHQGEFCARATFKRRHGHTNQCACSLRTIHVAEETHVAQTLGQPSNLTRNSTSTFATSSDANPVTLFPAQHIAFCPASSGLPPQHPGDYILLSKTLKLHPRVGGRRRVCLIARLRMKHQHPSQQIPAAYLHPL